MIEYAKKEGEEKMNNFFRKVDVVIKKGLKYLIIIWAALIMLIINFSVLPSSGFPDWLAVIVSVAFVFMYVKYSKVWTIVINILIDLGFFFIGHGKEEGQQILLDFWNETLARIVAWAIVIIAIYFIFKSKKR